MLCWNTFSWYPFRSPHTNAVYIKTNDLILFHLARGAWSSFFFQLIGIGLAYTSIFSYPEMACVPNYFLDRVVIHSNIWVKFMQPIACRWNVIWQKRKWWATTFPPFPNLKQSNLTLCVEPTWRLWLWLGTSAIRVSEFPLKTLARTHKWGESWSWNDWDCWENHSRCKHGWEVYWDLENDFQWELRWLYEGYR